MDVDGFPLSQCLVCFVSLPLNPPLLLILRCSSPLWACGLFKKKQRGSSELQLSPPGSLNAAVSDFLRWVGICPHPFHCVPEFPVHCL